MKTQYSLQQSVFILTMILCVASSHGQTRTSGAASSDAIQKELDRILVSKDAAIGVADQQYADNVDEVEKRYEESLQDAQTRWLAKVKDARGAAVADLRALNARLAANGQLVDMVKVLKAIHVLTPEDREVTKALAAAGVDLRTLSPEPGYSVRQNQAKPSRIVIWNTHNSRFNTSGTQQCNVVLYQGTRPVWRSDEVTLPWERNNDTFAVVHAPAVKFDIVRVEITKWRGYSGGLSEIEVWQDGKNVALRRPTRASSAVDAQTTSAKVTDGVTSSLGYKNGYWLLPDNQTGWIEISLVEPVCQKVLQARVSARTPWMKVIQVQPGDMIDILATGKWWASPQISAGPDGGVGVGEDRWGRYRDRFYLQGRLDGEVFKIGSRYTLRATKAGVLELGMNEVEVAWFANNSGYLDVALNLRKAPPSPAEALLPENNVPATVVSDSAAGR